MGVGIGREPPHAGWPGWGGPARPGITLRTASRPCRSPPTSRPGQTIPAANMIDQRLLYRSGPPHDTW